MRSRVLVGLLFVAFVASAAAVTVTATTRGYLTSQLDERLLSFAGHEEQEDLRSLIDDYVTNSEVGEGHEGEDGYEDEHDEGISEDPLTERPSDVLRGILFDDGTFATVLSPNIYGDEEFSLPAIDPATLSTTEDTYLTVSSTGDEEYRVLARPGEGAWVITSLSLEGVEAASHRLVMIEALSIVAVIGGLALVGWWVISLGVTPMRRMVDASTLIAEGNLDARLDGAGSGTESGALAASLNTMISTLTDSIAEKERSEAKLRDFVADASHELRTPLTTVLGYAQLFRRGALGDESALTDAWTRTESEAGRMKRLVEDLLELARYDAEPGLHVAVTDVNLLVEEVLADARRAYEGVTFMRGHGPVAPDIEAPTLATVDADRLRQAVINVVTNAAQHGAHAVTVTVLTLEAASGQRVRIEVADDGPGMSPEVAARATERFVRGDSSRSRATGGAGLGLAITAAIVDAHGGVLDIVSVLGQGTTVAIVIPV